MEIMGPCGTFCIMCLIVCQKSWSVPLPEHQHVLSCSSAVADEMRYGEIRLVACNQARWAWEGNEALLQ